MSHIRSLAAAVLAGGALFAGCGQARADALLDFSYSEGWFMPVRLGVPAVYSPYLSYHVASDGVIVPGSAFTAPIAPGTVVFDLTGDVLAATAATLTNGRFGSDFYVDAYSFTIYLGPNFGAGVAFREAYDFFPGGMTDLDGALIDGVRLTLFDLCLQPTGDPVCFDADYVGYRTGIRFQVFGTRGIDVPEPATAAMLATPLLLLGAARRRRPGALRHVASRLPRLGRGRAACAVRNPSRRVTRLPP